MSNVQQSTPIIDEKTENPKVLRWAGGILFGLGLLAVFLAYVEDVSEEKISMVLNAAVLLSLGYPMLLHVRALQKIAMLEQRLRDLEQRNK